MKKHLMLLLLCSLIACQQSDKPAPQDSPNEKDDPEEALPDIRPKVIADLHRIDDRLFPGNPCDTLRQLSWESFQSLPEIENIRYFAGIDGRYFCNRSFSAGFKTYLIAGFEGGDCGPAIWLFNVSEDSVLAQKIIYQACGWEAEKYKYSTFFLNDSSFVLNYQGEGIAIDSKGEYISDSLDLRNVTETYEIAANGGLRMLLRQEDVIRKHK